MPEGGILIVDDNRVNLKLFELLLKNAGYAVDTATTGREALDSVARRRYDLILMDVQLPDADGLSLTRQIKADSTYRRTRIVAVTAFALHEDRERALAAGCDGFIAKPIDTRHFHETVATYLEGTT